MKSLAPLVSREMQIKTPVREYDTPIRMGKILKKKTENGKSNEDSLIGGIAK